MHRHIASILPFVILFLAPAAGASRPPEPAARALGSGEHAGDAPVDEPDSVVRPSSRPFVVTLGLGPSLGIAGCNDAGCDSSSSVNQFMLTEELGYHFSGDGEGPAIGFSIDEAFGERLLRVQPGVKFWWDIQPSESLGLYVAPFVKAGYAYLEVDAGPFGSLSDHAFNPQAGVALHLSLEDRAQILFRPVVLDMLVNEDGFAIGYDIAAGGGVTF